MKRNECSGVFKSSIGSFLGFEGKCYEKSFIRGSDASRYDELPTRTSS